MLRPLTWFAPPAGSAIHANSWPWYVACAYAGCYVLWAATGAGGGTALGPLVEEIAPDLLLLAVVVTFGQVFASDAADSRIRRAFGWLAVAFGLSLLGDVWWVYAEFALGQDPRFSIANAPYLFSYPATVVGVLSFPVARREKLERWKFLLDNLAVLLAGFIAIWYFGVLPLLAGQADPLLAAVSLVYPVADLVVLTAFTTLLLRPPLDGRESSRRLLAGGMFVILVADITYEPAVLRTDTGVPWATMLYAASYLMLLRCGMDYRRSPRLAARSDNGVLSTLQPLSWLPFGTAALVIFALLVTALSPWQSPMSPLVLGGIGVTSLLLIRYGLTASQSLRILTEQIARESEVRLEALVEHASDPVLVVDEEAIVRYASPAITATLGLSPAELTGQRLEALADAEDGVRLTQFLAESHLPAGVVGTLWVRLRHADGSWRSIEAVATNLRQTPSIRGVVLNLRDVTERDDLEARLREAERLEAVGRLAGIIAHEFNSQLTGVLGHAELLLDRIGPGSPLRHELKDIRISAARCAELTQQLLTSSGHFAAAPRPVDFGRIVGDVMREFSERVRSDIRAMVEIEPTLGWVRGDQQQLVQAVTVLLDEVQVGIASGGTVALRATNVDVIGASAPRYHDVKSGPCLVVEVGSWIPFGVGETPPPRFEPLPPGREAGEARGIGLASVVAVAQRCGGVVGMEWLPDGGSRFVLILPRVAAPEPNAASMTSRVLAGGARTVLLVDDESVVLRLAQRALTAHGYRVLVASNSEEALRACSQHGPAIDLLLTDVRMPDVNGPALAAEISRLHLGIRVLYMSGYSADELGSALTPADALLHKPFSRRELLDAVDRTLT